MNVNGTGFHPIFNEFDKNRKGERRIGPVLCKPENNKTDLSACDTMKS